MTRSSLGRAAVRLYPTEIREARGEELVGTLLDAGDASLTAFVAELCSLVSGALRARSNRAMAVPIPTLIFELLCWGAVVTVAREFVAVVAGQLRFDFSLGGSTQILAYDVLPALMLIAFTARRPRLAGLLGLLWVVAILYVRWSPLGWSVFPRWSIEELLMPVIGSLLMIVAPSRAPSSVRWLWLVPAAVWALHELTAFGGHSGIGMVAPVAVTLLLLPLQPSVALGTALAWTLLLSWYLPAGNATWTVELAGCAPAALILAALCRRVSARPQSR
jgi:hypothetical protein